MPELICALGPDNAGSVLADLIHEARATLDVGMYEVGPSYAWALVAAARRGVRVRLILDGHRSDGNAGTAVALATAGADCRVLPRGIAAGHWKLVLSDGGRAAVGTGNLIWRDAPRHAHGGTAPAAPLLRGTREWWAVTNDSGVTGVAAAALEAAWDAGRRPPDDWLISRHAREDPGAVGTPAPQVAVLRLAPEDGRVRLVVGGLAVAGCLRDAIDGARSRVLITAPYIAGRPASVRTLVATASIARRRGVDVRLLLGARPQPSHAAHLARAGIPVRWMDPAASTRGHAKGLVADGTAMVTSANWSRAGFGANWEALLVVDSAPAAEYLAAAWQRDWTTAQALISPV